MNETELLLRDLIRLFRTYVFFPINGQATAVALWTMHTHVFDAADVTPYLAILSPRKRSGKTRLLELLDLLVPNPERSTNVSNASLYSPDEGDLPTLLLDEADTIFGSKASEHEVMRGLLNSGYRRGTYVTKIGMAGTQRIRFRLPVFYPKAIAAIGTLPDTVMDRSIPIHLRRKLPSEGDVARFRQRDAEVTGAELKQRLEEWAKTNVDALRDARPEIPDQLNDRAMDSWEPLLAIAELAGGKRAARVRDVAVRFNTGLQEMTEGELLLHHVWQAFEEKDADKLSTRDLLTALCDRDDGPWADKWGKALLDQDDDLRGPGYALNRLFKPFGLQSQYVRINERTQRGYRRDAVHDAWLKSR